MYTAPAGGRDFLSCSGMLGQTFQFCKAWNFSSFRIVFRMIFVLLNNLKLFISLSLGAKSNKIKHRLHTIAVVQDLQYLAGMNIMANFSIKAKDCCETSIYQMKQYCISEEPPWAWPCQNLGHWMWALTEAISHLPHQCLSCHHLKPAMSSSSRSQSPCENRCKSLQYCIVLHQPLRLLASTTMLTSYWPLQVTGPLLLQPSFER